MFHGDATWELLSEIRVKYAALHLKDKVIDEAEGDVTAQEVEEEEENTENIPQVRAKRNRLKPKWLKDYELP